MPVGLASFKLFVGRFHHFSTGRVSLCGVQVMHKEMLLVPEKRYIQFSLLDILGLEATACLFSPVFLWSFLAPKRGVPTPSLDPPPPVFIEGGRRKEEGLQLAKLRFRRFIIELHTE